MNGTRRVKKPFTPEGGNSCAGPHAWNSSLILTDSSLLNAIMEALTREAEHRNLNWDTDAMDVMPLDSFRMSAVDHAGPRIGDSYSRVWL